MLLLCSELRILQFWTKGFFFGFVEIFCQLEKWVCSDIELKIEFPDEWR